MRCGIALAVAGALVAQDARFSVQSRLVLVPVMVTDGKGHSVETLEPSDFVLLDNGKAQATAVDTFATGVAPIALMVAVQSSGISTAALAKVQKVGAMIQPLISGERGCAGLVSFAQRIEWLQECTSDPNALANAFDQLRPGEAKSARMLDAVDAAVERLRKRTKSRRVLFLISESRDRGSETDLDSVVMRAQAADVAVYAATYSAFKTAFTARPEDSGSTPMPRSPGPPRPKDAEGPPNKDRPPVPAPEQRVDILGGFGELARLSKTKTTEVLTKTTGGTAFSFARLKGLEDAIEKLGTELHSQYVLSFTPEKPDPGYHRLQVQITRSGKFNIRARPGYWLAGSAR